MLMGLTVSSLTCLDGLALVVLTDAHTLLQPHRMKPVHVNNNTQVCVFLSVTYYNYINIYRRS